MSEQELPDIDFATFVLSLNHSALMHLGDVPDPETHVKRVDLALAREDLAILSMLEEKTRGNLTGEEERLLAQVLFDLRIRCTEKSKK